LVDTNRCEVSTECMWQELKCFSWRKKCKIANQSTIPGARAVDIMSHVG